MFFFQQTASTQFGWKRGLQKRSLHPRNQQSRDENFIQQFGDSVRQKTRH